MPSVKPPPLVPSPGLGPDQLLLESLPPGEDFSHHHLVPVQVVRVQLVPFAWVVSNIVEKWRIVFLRKFINDRYLLLSLIFLTFRKLMQLKSSFEEKIFPSV